MPVTIDQEKCDGCECCIDECPSDAIELVDGKAHLKEDDCCDCGSCVEVCPTGAITE